MMFFKMFLYDLKNGLWRERRKHLFLFILGIAFSVDFQLRWNMIASDTKPSYGEFLLYLFKGMEEYIPSPLNNFRYPEIWILIMLLIVYRTLYYPYQDLLGMGKQVLINSESRRRWWLSKCCWILCSVLADFIIFWATTFVFCLVSGAAVSLDISIPMYQYMRVTMTKEMPVNLNIQIFLMPVLVMASLGLMQMTLSFLIKPFYSFAVTVVVFVSSCYDMNPWMIGNYAMAQRSSLLLREGMEAGNGIFLSLLLGLLSAGIGLIFFKRYDILNIE